MHVAWHQWDKPELLQQVAPEFCTHTWPLPQSELDVHAVVLQISLTQTEVDSVV